MNFSTKLFLIFLRLAIGWHLLFAGLAKFAPDYRGSEGYLQEATGPLAPEFHQMVGDQLAEMYAVRPQPGDQPPDAAPTAERCPLALARKWDDYCDTFIAHYHLDAAAQERCRAAVRDEEQKTAEWMLNGKLPLRITSKYGPPVTVERTPLQRLAEYQTQRAKVRKEQGGDEFTTSLETAFGPEKTKSLLAEKGEVARTRSELSGELERRTGELREALRGVLTPAQAQETAPLPAALKPSWMAMTRLDWIDFMVRWGLTLSGAGLILGFFSRTSCVVAALLLLSFYLAVMPVPGVIEAVRVEGYPYVNKNLVEMLALLTLATTASGRWAGLDAFVYYLNPFRRPRNRPQPPPPGGYANGSPAPRPEPVFASSPVPSRS